MKISSSKGHNLKDYESRINMRDGGRQDVCTYVYICMLVSANTCNIQSSSEIQMVP
jgi:hypothetical protein